MDKYFSNGLIKQPRQVHAWYAGYVQVLKGAARGLVQQKPILSVEYHFCQTHVPRDVVYFINRFWGAIASSANLQSVKPIAGGVQVVHLARTVWSHGDSSTVHVCHECIYMCVRSYHIYSRKYSSSDRQTDRLSPDVRRTDHDKGGTRTQ